MPQKQTSGEGGLFRKLGQRLVEAAETHKADPVEYSNFGEIPSGIEGIAQLIECKFVQIEAGKDNAGEYRFQAAGSIVEPAEFEGKRVFGLQPRIFEPMYETPGRSRETLEDHVGWVQNELKKLLKSGSNDSTDYSEMLSAENLESTCRMLTEAAPYFRFRTWRGHATPEFPNPRTNVQFLGQTVYSGGDQSGTEDSTPPAAPPGGNGSARAPAARPSAGGGKAPAKPASPAPPAKAPPRPANPPALRPSPAPPPPARPAPGQSAQLKKPGPKTAPAPTAPTPPGGIDEFSGDLGEVVDRANRGDPEAADRLKSLAMEAGMEEDAVDSADSWQDVVDEMNRLAAEGGGEGDGAEGEADEFRPEVDQVWHYFPVVKGKKAAKPVEIQILEVADDRTVKAKNLDNPKTIYPKVGWEELVGAEE